MRTQTYYARLQQYPTYRAARFYCFQCGFSVVPLHHQSKARLFKGTHFQEWYPCDQHLQKWWCNRHDYGLAIVPGEISNNLVILDFDAPGSFDAWHQATGLETPRVRTRRGVHVYVRLSEMVQNGKGSFQGRIFGDVIAHGNITAPPSRHPSGHQYAWEGDPRTVPLFPCLASLSVTRIAPDGGTAQPRKAMPKARRGGTQIYGIETGTITNKLAYARAALTGERRKVANAPEGQRNQALYRAALTLAKFVNILSENTIMQELHNGAIAAGMTEHRDSITPTIRSGLRTGVQQGVIEL